MSRARTRACVLHVSNLAAGSSESWDQESSAAFVLLKPPQNGGVSSTRRNFKL